MKWCIWITGKTTPTYYNEACADYYSRLKRMADIEITTLPDIRQAGSLSIDILKKKEGDQVLQKTLRGDYLVLLDDKGISFTSETFAAWLEKISTMVYKRCIFVVGGAYGFDKALYDRANMQLSLSSLTFSHQLVRVVFLEQLYRGFCINKGLPYHHS